LSSADGLYQQYGNGRTSRNNFLNDGLFGRCHYNRCLYNAWADNDRCHGSGCTNNHSLSNQEQRTREPFGLSG
jgi:hypothetical protein